MQKQKNAARIQLDPNIIVQAFQVLANPNNQQQVIKNADNYIQQCEQNPQFTLMLIAIFSQLESPQTKWQMLIHLKNVIIRNWTSKRRANQQFQITLGTKNQIKQKLLQLYKHHWKLYYKQFNSIYKYLSYQDFPSNYPELNQFIKQILMSVSQCNIQQLLTSQQLIPYLSLVKIVYKQHSQRRTLHSVQNYNKYMLQSMYVCVKVMTNIGQVLKLFEAQSQTNSIDFALGNKFLQCSRKIDKILLYSLQCISSGLQYDKNIIEVVKLLLQKMNYLLSLKIPVFMQNIQLNVLAIAQGVGRLQSHFPLLFAPFLKQYLEFNLSLLFDHKFDNQKLLYTILQINTTPFKTFTYYMSQQEFKLNLEYKPMNEHPQQVCHKIYRQVYSQKYIGGFMQRIISQLMTNYQRSNLDNQIMFEQGDQAQGLYQKSVFEGMIILLTNVMQRFIKQARAFCYKIIQYLMQHRSEHTKIINTMYELILLVPKIFKQEEKKQMIKMLSIRALLMNCYEAGNYHMYCRLVRVYSPYFKQQELAEIFKHLIQIIQRSTISTSNITNTADTSHNTIYQSSVCIHRIISSPSPSSSAAYPVHHIGACLYKIFALIQIYKENPEHVWNLLNLLIKILKSLSKQIILYNLSSITHSINVLAMIKDNRSGVLEALCQLLQTILVMINAGGEDYVNVHKDMNNYTNMHPNHILQIKHAFYQTCLQIVHYCPQTGGIQQQTLNSKYLLWLCIIKNISIHNTTPALTQKLLHTFALLNQSVLNQQPSLFLQILEQYLLSGIYPHSQLSPSTLHEIYKQYIKQLQTSDTQDACIMIAYLSLYYTYVLTQPASQSQEPNSQLLHLCIQYILQLTQRVSPHINTLRMLAMLIINHHIIIYGGEAIFTIFNNLYKHQYTRWFWPYVQGLEYINNKYSSKVATYAILKQFQTLATIVDQPIEENIPFDNIIKFVTLYTDPLLVEQAVNGYVGSIVSYTHLERLEQKIMADSHITINSDSSGNKYINNLSRRFRCHINYQWCALDLNQLYAVQMRDMFQRWDWAEDDLHARYSDTLVLKIVSILNGTHTSTNGNTMMMN